MTDDIEQKKALAHYQHTLDRALEEVKDHFERNRLNNTAKLQQADNSFEATIKYGLGVLRGAFILNGGAAIGTASLLSGAINRGATSDLTGAILWPLLLFTIGALLPVVASGLTYFSQHDFTQVQYFNVFNNSVEAQRKLKRAVVWQRWTIVLMVLDAVCFAAGAALGCFLLLQSIHHPVLT